MIPDWIPHVDLPSLGLGSLLGAVASTWHSYFVKRPKLQTVGSGSGNGTFCSNHIRIANSPGLLGIRIRETILFGYMLHNSKEYGLVVDRSPAHECRAWMYDKQTNQGIKLLWWRTSNHRYTQVVTLNSGESADLMLFARLGSEPKTYFIYQLKGPEVAETDIPDDVAKFDSTRDFIIEIQHSYGKKKFRIPCKMTLGFDGRLNFNCNGAGGGSF